MASPPALSCKCFIVSLHKNALTSKHFYSWYNISILSLASKRFIIHGYTAVSLSIWGCNGFDGDEEAEAAGSVELHFNRLKLLKINANKNLAYAA